MNPRKITKTIRRKSKLLAVEKIVNGKKVVQYYNPAKHLAKMEVYKDKQGTEALNVMLNRYASFMNANQVDTSKLEEKNESKSV